MCGVVDGCIMCMAFRGILCWVLCLILCVVDYSLTSALERVFSSCLLFRKVSEKPLRGLTSGFSLCEASLSCVVFCVFCCGFSHDI